MIPPSPFSGTGVALITPFKDGKVDYAALERIIEHVIAGGVDYLVSLGTTGESVTLSTAECREVVSFTTRQVNQRKPVVVGMFGGNNTAHLVNRIHDFDFEGCAAMLSSNPAYNKPSQEGIYQHYKAVADASPIPIILYNVPGRSASNVAPDTVMRLIDYSDRFVAIKEASGDILQGSKLLKDKPEQFQVLSGDDPTALPLVALGGSGVISVIANAYPAEFSKMIRAALNGNFETAARLHLRLFDLHKWLYIDGNPSGIKAALEIMGFCTTDTRLPLVPMSEKNYSNLKREMERIRRAQKITIG